MPLKGFPITDMHSHENHIDGIISQFNEVCGRMIAAGE
jgi:hypothetical protein